MNTVWAESTVVETAYGCWMLNLLVHHVTSRLYKVNRWSRSGGHNCLVSFHLLQSGMEEQSWTTNEIAPNKNAMSSRDHVPTILSSCGWRGDPCWPTWPVSQADTSRYTPLPQTRTTEQPTHDLHYTPANSALSGLRIKTQTRQRLPWPVAQSANKFPVF